MFWDLESTELAAAQQGDANAAQRIFALALPVCHRMAITLSGSFDIARTATIKLAQQAQRKLPDWADADDAARWFMHHTILLMRQHAVPLPWQNDALLHDVGGPHLLQYQQMIQALRKLPLQQQEAFLLTIAQRWNARYVAVAMDCSTTAVTTHLEEAHRQLRPMLGKSYDALCQALCQVHRTLPIQLPVNAADLAVRIRTRRSFAGLAQVAGWIIILTGLLVIAYFAWTIYPRIET